MELLPAMNWELGITVLKCLKMPRRKEDGTKGSRSAVIHLRTLYLALAARAGGAFMQPTGARVRVLL